MRCRCDALKTSWHQLPSPTHSQLRKWIRNFEGKQRIASKPKRSSAGYPTPSRKPRAPAAAPQAESVCNELMNSVQLLPPLALRACVPNVTSSSDSEASSPAPTPPSSPTLCCFQSARREVSLTPDKIREECKGTTVFQPTAAFLQTVVCQSLRPVVGMPMITPIIRRADRMKMHALPTRPTEWLEEGDVMTEPVENWVDEWCAPLHPPPDGHPPPPH